MFLRSGVSWLATACLLVSCSGDKLDAAVATSTAHAAPDNGAQTAAVEQDPPPSAAACGNAGLPDCPLQRWMKATLQTYQRANDTERLARAFNELAEHAPSGYDSWKTLSQQGARAAAHNDAAAVKQICKDCHQAHRAHYRQERRAAPVW